MISNKISPRRQLANALRRLVAPRRSKLRLKLRIGYAPFPPTMNTHEEIIALRKALEEARRARADAQSAAGAAKEQAASLRAALQLARRLIGNCGIIFDPAQVAEIDAALKRT